MSPPTSTTSTSFHFGDSQLCSEVQDPPISKDIDPLVCGAYVVAFVPDDGLTSRISCEKRP